MGRREHEDRKRKAAKAKSFQSLDTWVSKVPNQEPSDTDNDSAICDDSRLSPRLRSFSVNYRFTARYRR